MKLLSDSFQRTLVIKDFIKWIKIYSPAFIKPIIINNPQIQTTKQIEEPIIVKKQDDIEEQIIVKKQDDIEEQIIIEE